MLYLLKARARKKYGTFNKTVRFMMPFIDGISKDIVYGSKGRFEQLNQLLNKRMALKPK